MKALRIALGAASFVCFSGLIGVFVPMSHIARLAVRYGGAGTAPGPEFEYLFRLTAAVMAGCGAFYGILAWNPRAHGSLVPVSGGAILFVGLVLLVAGLSAGMITWVVLSDFLSCALVGAAILVTWLLWGRGPVDT
jgi:hypothetical protein